MDDLESELDHLYAVEPEEFVAERNRISRALREADRRDEAEQVKALRKPSVSAWTVNQLARLERRQVDLLLDAGHRLREAQQGVLAGEQPKALDEARRTEREALAALGDAARDLLAERNRASDATLRRVAETLQAAAISAEGRELLARGRLTGDLEPAGFELLAPLAPAAPKRKRTPSRRPSNGKEKKRLDEARAAAEEAAKSVRTAEEDARKARGELSKSEKRLRTAQSAAARADAAVVRAEELLRKAERSAK